MSRTIAFYAVAVDQEIPKEIREHLDDRIEIRIIFGIKCYVILEDDEVSPLNLLDEELYRKVKRWLSTISADKVFSHIWKAG
jgi:hypothetical protein